MLGLEIRLKSCLHSNNLRGDPSIRVAPASLVLLGAFWLLSLSSVGISALHLFVAAISMHLVEFNEV